MGVGVAILQTSLDNGMASGHQSFQERRIFCRPPCTSTAKMKALHFAGCFTLDISTSWESVYTPLPSSVSPLFQLETKKNSPLKVTVSRNNSFSDKPLAMKNIFFFVRFLDTINKKILNTHYLGQYGSSFYINN